jgi:hypothetical protein
MDCSSHLSIFHELIVDIYLLEYNEPPVGDRSDMAVLRGQCQCHPIKQLADSREIWYQGYAIEGESNYVHYNIL